VLSSLGMDWKYIFPSEITLIRNSDALVIAGGFSYGDYLRPGAIASHSPIAKEITEFVKDGRFVIGICNGFQILCELGILPGVLTTNISTKFICRWVNIKSEKNVSKLLAGLEGKTMKIPIAHYDGRYYDELEKIEKLNINNQIAFRYCNLKKEIPDKYNPNGSIENIAGITNETGTVLGMMPHPERASFSYLGSEDGKIIFENLKSEIKC
jgi:phosphoribosylformylglycinamidine synthase